MASSSLSQKVCVVCRRSRVTGCSEYWIYIVDLNSAKGYYFSRKNPTFRVRDDGSFSNPCFSVLGSTLYVFQGYEPDSKFITRGKTVYTHPLPSSSDTDCNLRLTRSTMSVAKAPLQDVKFWPTAVPTPDGKQILVVSTHFRDFVSCLELYDPSRQTSTVIRAPPLECRGLNVLSVRFIGPRTVLFWTTAGPDNTDCWRLDYDDLRGADPEWVQLECNNLPIGLVLRHGWWFTPSTVHDFCDDRGLRAWWFKYRPSPLPGDDHSSSVINYDITPLSDGVDSFCTLRVGRTLRPFVMLDVYKFDLDKHREQVAEVCSRVREDEDLPTPFPGVELVKSIRFFDPRQLDYEQESFLAHSFFSIPTTSA